MTTIRLLDARRGLNLKCRELFRDEKIAEAIYRYLCDGIEECEDAQPERKKGKWERHYCEDGNPDGWRCDKCDEWYYFGQTLPNFCPNCGADMRGGNP